MAKRSGPSGYSKGAGAYARMGVESRVMSASPHQLIVMLFDGARTAIRTARLHMVNGSMPEKGEAIAQALDIITQGLMAGLDRERGGDIAQNLADLYDYIGRLLLRASLENDPEKLDEASRLLADIGSAWNEVGKQETEGAR